VLPNPSNGHFAVQLPQASRFIRLEVLNAAGAVEQRLSVNGRLNVPVYIDKAGVYFVRLVAATETALIRVAVVK
jgi:hypothetical protein